MGVSSYSNCGISKARTCQPGWFYLQLSPTALVPHIHIASEKIHSTIVVGDSLESDKEVLLNLKTNLKDHNRVNRGKFSDWNQNSSPCTWPGISCDRGRVTGIDLSNSDIAGSIHTLVVYIHPEFSTCRTFQISGYIQLSRNQLSGEVPSEIGKMKNFSMLQLGTNGFYGNLPPEIGLMPLVVLNISQNKFSGEIPVEIGRSKCLRDLDLSYNNFSGAFPISMNNLTELSKFNVSYNPYITGVIPAVGQLSTFSKESFIGDPLLILPSFMNDCTDIPTAAGEEKPTKRQKKQTNHVFFCVFFIMIMGFLGCGLCGIVILIP